MNALSNLKPTLKRRFALRLAVLATAISILGAAYWFTRAPELVWWRSPPMGKTGHRIRVLIPQGWELDPPQNTTIKSADMVGFYRFFPADGTPKVVRWLIPKRKLEHAALNLSVTQ